MKRSCEVSSISDISNLIKLIEIAQMSLLENSKMSQTELIFAKSAMKSLSI